MAEMGRGYTFILQNAYPGTAIIRKPACVQAGFFKKLELLHFLGLRFAEVHLLPVHVTCMTHPSALYALTPSNVLVAHSVVRHLAEQVQVAIMVLQQYHTLPTWYHTRNRTPFDFVKSWLQRFL